MRRARWGVLAGALAVSIGSRARAAAKPTHHPPAPVVEGIARVKKGDFEAARLSFAQAYTVLHKPVILWNLALAEEKSGHVVEALGHFRELDRAPMAGEDRAKAKKHVETLMAQTGHIEVVAAAGTKVDVDGADAGVTPLADAVDVLPGKHHVVAGEKATDADVSAGETAHVSFLVLEPPAPSSALPAEHAAPPAQERAVPETAAVAATTPAPEAPEQGGTTADPMARAITVITIGTLAVTGGVLGVTFALQSKSNANTAAAAQAQLANNPSACTGATSSGTCGQLKDAVDAENRDHTLSNVFYGTGAVLAAGAVVTWLLWPKHATASTAWVFPMLETGGGGVGFVGRF